MTPGEVSTLDTRTLREAEIAGRLFKFTSNVARTISTLRMKMRREKRLHLIELDGGRDDQ
jgi:hypothetical protein